MKPRKSLLQLSTNGVDGSIITTGRSSSNLSSSCSVRQLITLSTCSNKTFPAHLSLKNLKPESWQRFFDGRKQPEISQTKNKADSDTTLADESVTLSGDRTSNENSQYSFLPPPIQTHIDRLYEQIDDLTLQLSEERLNHKQTRILAAELLSNQLKDQENKYELLLKNNSYENKIKLKEQEEKYVKLLNNEKTESLQREDKLRSELEFVKNSFHIYKIHVEKENSEEIQRQTNEILETMKNQQIEREEEIKQRIHDVIVKERRLAKAKYRSEIENMQKKIDINQNTLKNGIVGEDKGGLLNHDLQSAQYQLHQLKQVKIELTIRLKQLEKENIEIKRELKTYRMRFKNRKLS